MRTEQWNIPGNYEDLVVGGDCQYSILGVETHDNMDSMRRFVEAVGIPSEKIEVDGGTQIVVTHPDLAKVIVIDAGGLGDFYDSGFDVSIEGREDVGLGSPDALMAEMAANRLSDAAPDLLEALEAMLESWAGFSEGELKRREHLGFIDTPTLGRILRARAAIAKARQP